MDPHDGINAFTLAAHRLAVDRLRERPARLAEAKDVLARWRRQAGAASHCDGYWDEWDRLLGEGIDAVERAVCAETDHAATLRSVSPLGRFVSPSERLDLLRRARDPHEA